VNSEYRLRTRFYGVAALVNRPQGSKLLLAAGCTPITGISFPEGPFKVSLQASAHSIRSTRLETYAQFSVIARQYASM
jgi:hypothetical protein